MKDPLKVKGRPMDFDVTNHKKFIDKVSHSTLELTLKKLPNVNFGII